MKGTVGACSLMVDTCRINSIQLAGMMTGHPPQPLLPSPLAALCEDSDVSLTMAAFNWSMPRLDLIFESFGKGLRASTS